MLLLEVAKLQADLQFHTAAGHVGSDNMSSVASGQHTHLSKLVLSNLLRLRKAQASNRQTDSQPEPQRKAFKSSACWERTAANVTSTRAWPLCDMATGSKLWGGVSKTTFDHNADYGLGLITEIMPVSGEELGLK